MPKPTKPHILRIAPAAVLLIVLILGIQSALSGCTAPSSDTEQVEITGGNLYQIQNGRFTEVPNGNQLSTATVQPWTVQQRVSDMVALGEWVYLGVNGYGIAELLPDAEGNLNFKYFYDPLIFRYRTLTTLIPERAAQGYSVLCHVYFNEILNVVSPTELKLQGISLLRLLPSTGVYSFCTPLFQEEHPDWEAVGFVPVKPEDFYLQWKYSDSNRTLFSYTHFDLAGLKEEEIDALAYRKSYGFEDARETAVLRILLTEARSLLDAAGISTAYQLHIRSEDQPLLRRFEYHPDDFTSARQIRLYTLPGAYRDGNYLLLLPDGLLLQGTSGSRQIRRFRLPSLPDGHLYTDLLLHGSYLLAGWEQAEFTDVGAAGIFFAEVPLIR